MNIWVQPLAYKRKHCHHCEADINGQNQHIAIGGYLYGRWRKWSNACGKCMVGRINDIFGDRLYTICSRSGYSMPWYVGKDKDNG